MYPFERFLHTLKCKIKNPRYVEGSIAEAFLVEEATKFASYYYPPEVISRWRGYLATMMVVYRVVRYQYSIILAESWESIVAQLWKELIRK
ncbi:hypothetical protein K1719_021557 [Acacia pycnantha]|nr:hypothetical protein K1719_021557 [Acacia pycnantha]